MEWVETAGRTIDEAKEAALDQLGVDESDAEFVIVTEPRAGLFGRLRGEARVRARVRPTSPRPKRTRARRDRERRADGGGARSRKVNGADRAGGVAVAEGTGPDERPVGTAADNGAPPQRNRNRRSRGGRGAGRSQQGAGPNGDGGSTGSVGEEGGSAPAATAGRNTRRSQRGRPPGTTKEEPVGDTLSLEEQGETARTFVAGLLQELGMPAQVSARMIDDDTAEVSVEGHDLGVLIGPGGATLGALQELARTYVQKQTGGHSGRIVVDVAGYRAKRVAALQRFTRQVAEEVKASGDERTLEPMSAADRKVVHDTINEMGGLATRSEGEEPRRYIVISTRQPETADSDA